MKLLLENWRKYVKEDITDDILDALEKTPHKAGEKERGERAARWQKNPPSGEADWKKFKQWRDFTRAHEAGVASSGVAPYDDAQPPEAPEDYEKALKQKSSQKYEDILKFNCEAIKKEVFGGNSMLFRGEGGFDCQSLVDATQGTKPGEGSPSQIFKSAKFVKELGSGAYGVAVLFDNDHIVKFFKGGVGAGRNDPLLSELEGYENLLDSQLAGTAKSYDLAVYEFGRIPVQTYKWIYRRDGADKVPDDGPQQYVGYAEIGKVIPFGNWVKDKYNEDTAKEISEFIWDDLAMGLDDARRAGIVKRFDEIGGGAEKYIDYIMNGDSFQSRLGDLGITPPAGVGHAATNKARGPRGADRSSWPTRSSKPDSATVAARGTGVRARAPSRKHPKRDIDSWPGVEKHGLAYYSRHVQRYGWAADKDNYFDLPAIPPALSYGLGKKFLHSLLTSVYRAAKLNGDDYLYGNATSDIHEGNFGISYQTGEVIIFDR